MPIEDNNLNILVDVLLEFIEAFIHQVIHLRSIYPPAAFERQKLYGIAVQKARHPELVEYIHQVVHGLKVGAYVTITGYLHWGEVAKTCVC